MRLMLLLSSLLSGCRASTEEEPGVTEIYYVDSQTGDDDNAGRSEQAAWRTLAKVNRAGISPGARVLFRRGQIFRGQLVPASGVAGQPTHYGSFGEGELPELRGSLELSSPSRWQEHSLDSQLWVSTEAFETDVGNLIFDGGRSFGQKRWSEAELAAAGDFWFDRVTGKLVLRAEENPALLHSSIEAALRKHIVDFAGKAHLVFEELSLRYGAGHGFGGGSTRNITIRDCEVSYVGGGDLDMDGSNTRFGNGIEFWGDARDHLVENNLIFETYDTALSNQNHTSPVTQQNITYRNNIIHSNAMASFEIWNRPEESKTEGIVFENNTAMGAGQGWGAPPQRPDEQGVHLLLSYNPAVTSSVVIRNNVFVGGKLALWVAHATQWESALTLDHNCYHQPEGELFLINGAEDAGPQQAFGADQFQQWTALSGADAHSVLAEPLFRDPEAQDYRLQSASSCAGISSDGGDPGVRP